jgi:Xaa-Pro dipeptidase
VNEHLDRLYEDHLAGVQRTWSHALELAGCAGVLIHSGSPPMVFLDDHPYPYKVNAPFKHWAPVLDNPHCFVLFRPGEVPVMLFHRPVGFWHKPADVPGGYWTRYYDLRIISCPEDARNHLGSDPSRLAFVGETQALFEDWGLGSSNPSALLDCVNYHRAWKSDYELACLHEASQLGAAAHLAAEQAFRRGASEYQIHLDYLAASGHAEHELPYGNIIALNDHGSVLHYQRQSHRPPPRHLSLVIDAGAQSNGYAADITRSYAAASDEYGELVEAMDTGQRELCDQVRPGLPYPDLQRQAHRLTADLLARFRFVNMEADNAVASGITRYFFPHGVGHYLGLQVHDVGGFLVDEGGTVLDPPEDQPFLRLTRTVEERQVFTVEPGLYFIHSLLSELKNTALSRDVNWERVDAFRPYGGVRIEDNVVVTAGGHENLTRQAFASAGH